MFAIVEIAGQQFKVEKDQYLYVNRVEGEAGATLQFDRVLLTADGSTVNLGMPMLSGMTVSARILEQVRDNKVLIFKKKRRKGYRRQMGHRQYLTKLQIESIG